MGLQSRAVRFGPEALAALGEAINEAKGNDPLAPVTVVVERPAVGLAARRSLAATGLSGAGGPLGSAGSGIANVRFVTWAGLAELLGDRAIAASGKLPAERAVVLAAARQVLAEARGPLFGAVREHPATVRALAGTYRDLRGTGPEVRSRLARASARADEVMQLIEAMNERLSGWYDEIDVIDAAVDRLGADGEAALVPVGAVLVYLARVLPMHQERLVRALAEHGAVTVLVGATGDAVADRSAATLLERLGAPADPDAVSGHPPVGTSVVSAPAADTEVLMAVRSMMTRHQAGVPLDRMAIVHGGVGPYSRLVQESLSAAGVPFNGSGLGDLSATVVGRVLLGAFEMVERGWRRDDVVAWLSCGPLRHDGRPVPATEWDLLSRRAGVLSGLESWTERLGAFIEQREVALARVDQDALGEDRVGDDRAGQPAIQGGEVRRDIAWAQQLGRLVTGMADRFQRTPGTWSGWGQWATRMLNEFLGGPAQRTGWPAEEEQALVEIHEFLRRLPELETVAPRPDLSSFRAVLTAALEEPAPQTTRFGAGVLVGRVDQLIGLEFDTVYVVGMVEGQFPRRDSDDVLLPDHERESVLAEVPLRAPGSGDGLRDYLAALASAGTRVLSFARGDQRQGREQRPSRWVLETLAALEGLGRTLYSRNVEELDGVVGFEVVRSDLTAVGSDGAPVSLTDRDRRSVVRWWQAGRDIQQHYLVNLVPELERGLEARAARRRPGFSRFDGRVEVTGIPSPASSSPRSPTGLERYATCPRSYLLDTVLGVRVRERPEDVLRLQPKDRGTLIHAVLERFFAHELARPAGDRLQPDQGWTGADHARLAVMADEAFEELCSSGLAGRPIFWQPERARLQRDLQAFLDDDALYRSSSGAIPEAVELVFGDGVRPPVVLELADGQPVAFRGKADRVDRTTDGTIAVLDYKSGSDRGFVDIEIDPVVRGTKLQLPVYALAAEAQFGPGHVTAAYWFVGGSHDKSRIEYPLDDERNQRFTEVVDVIVEGITSGAFPANPGPSVDGGFAHCRFCDFDALCPNERGDEWRRVRGDRALARYQEMAEPDAASDIDGTPTGPVPA